MYHNFEIINSTKAMYLYPKTSRDSSASLQSGNAVLLRVCLILSFWKVSRFFAQPETIFSSQCPVYSSNISLDEVQFQSRKAAERFLMHVALMLAQLSFNDENLQGYRNRWVVMEYMRNCTICVMAWNTCVLVYKRDLIEQKHTSDSVSILQQTHLQVFDGWWLCSSSNDIEHVVK